MKYKKSDIAGSVTLYNSDVQVISNIHSFLPQIEHLFIIDNSEVSNFELMKRLEKLSNVTYVHSGINLGVAWALNKAADLAIAAGYQFLLTMDDDTYFPAGGVQKMINFISRYGADRLGILASQSNPQLFDDTTKQVHYTITSGSLLNLSAYNECGRFVNELFIDFVDHEYCFRLEKYGYEIVEMNNIHLKHNLGIKKQLTFFSYKIPVYWTSHNPLRIYYKIRNSIYSLNKYHLLDMRTKYVFYKEIIKDFLKIIFLENKKKIRIVLYLKGVYDGFTNNLGKRNFEF